MIDFHTHPENWGVHPILFNIGNISITSYSFFVLLGLVVGTILFVYESKKQKSNSKYTPELILAAIIGGVLGAKIPMWVLNYNLIINSFPDITPILSGRTITGGLIGGTLAVLLLKRHLKIKKRKGNLFAPAIALGVAIGRLGCFFAGCCYGIPTNLPWGVNFGDGILRHPTQIYEALFMLGMFFYLTYLKSKKPKPGQLFTILMIGYFTFRFFIEFIRVEPVIFLGLTFFQCVSIIVVFWFIIKEKILNSKPSHKQ